MVYCHQTQRWEEPSPEERERAMGFEAGTTAHPALAHRVRSRLMGQVMDLHRLTCAFTTGLAFHLLPPASLPLPVPLPVMSTTYEELDLIPQAVDDMYHFIPTMEGGEAPCMPSNHGTLVDVFANLEVGS